MNKTVGKLKKVLLTTLLTLLKEPLTFFNNSELINREVGCVHLSVYVKCTPKKE